MEGFPGLQRGDKKKGGCKTGGILQNLKQRTKKEEKGLGSGCSRDMGGMIE